MELALAAFLILGMAIGVVALIIAVPAAIGLMAYDVVKAPKTEPSKRPEASSTRIAVERGVARSFVLLGGAFWSIASFAGLYAYRQTGTVESLLAASIPLLACIVTLVVGWYFERFTAALLLFASLAVVAWGVIYQFELGVWMIMTFALIGPMLTASVLFWLARRDQEAYERVTQLRPQLSPVFAARSSLAA